MSRESCVVLVPVHQAIEPETENAIWELSRRGYPVRFLRGSSDIVLARSQMATQAIKDGFKETFWIDSDVVFDPNDVDRIREHNKPIIAGLYPRKGGRQGFAAKFDGDPKGQVFGEGGGLVPMAYVGMGFTYVRSDVYQAIGADMPECNGGYEGKTVTPYFLPLMATEPERPCYLAEDYSFCARAKMYGIEIFADTRIKLGHVGKHTWTWDDFGSSAEVERLQKAFDQENQTLLNAIATLAAIKNGSLKPAQLEVTDHSWKVLALQFDESMTINPAQPERNGVLAHG